MARKPKKLPYILDRGKSVSLGVTLSETMYIALQKRAVDRGSSISSVIREFLYSAMKKDKSI